MGRCLGSCKRFLGVPEKESPSLYGQDKIEKRYKSHLILILGDVLSGCEWQRSVKYCDTPRNSDPRIYDGVCWLEVRDVRSVMGSAFFDSMVFFNDSLISDNDG